MLKSVTTLLPSSEREVLAMMASEDVRPIGDQVRFLIISEAKRRGLLPAEPTRSEAQTLYADGMSVQVT